MTPFVAQKALLTTPTTPLGLPLLFLAALFLHGFYWFYSEPVELYSDYYKAYFPAGERILEEGWRAAWPFQEQDAAITFVNIPIVAWLFTPFAAMGEPVGGHMFLLAGIAAMCLCVRLLTKHFLRQGHVLGLISLFLVNGPLVNSMREGNTTHFVLLLLICAVVLLAKSRPMLAGAVIGLCAVVKLPLLLLGSYFVLRREWRGITGFFGGLLAVVGLSILVFGMQAHLDWYWSCVAPFMGKVIPAFNVQSIDGFLMRLDTGAGLLREWQPLQAEGWQKILRYAIILPLGALTAFVVWRGHTSRQTNFLAVSSLLTLAMIISPLSWSHYYLLFLLPFALYLCGQLPVLDEAVGRRLMLAAMILTSLPVIDIKLEPGAAAEAVARTIISLPLLGGLCLLFALVRGAWLLKRGSHA